MNNPATKATKPVANPAPRLDPGRAWAEAAINHELDNLSRIGDETIQKPGSQFSISLLKLASIIKGGGREYITADELIRKIQQAVATRPDITEKEIRRQWKRAHAKAEPRLPQPQKPNGVARPQQRPAQAPAQAPAAAAGIDIRNPKTEDFRKAFGVLGYDFKMNELDDSIWCNGERMTDGTEAIIRNRCRDIGLTSVSRVKDAYIQFAFESPFHPVRDYLNGLAWDGKDWISVFVSTFLNETTGFGETAFKRWMIGSVAKIFEQGQNFMLVWDGPQNIGKSTLARWLCPLPQFYIEGAIKPDDKDSLIRLASRWIWEVMELQSTTRKADKEALKAFITTEEVTVRKPYGVNDMIKPAMASLIGTINEDGSGFLTDPTGNRRFVIIRFESIDFDYTQLDPALLWAQAVAMYKAGEPWALTREERQKQAEINTNYEIDSVVSLLLFEHFEITEDPNAYTTAADILSELELAGLKGNQQANANEIGRIMKRLGVQDFRPLVNGRRPRAYRGVKRVGDGKDAKPVTF